MYFFSMNFCPGVRLSCGGIFKRTYHGPEVRVVEDVSVVVHGEGVAIHAQLQVADEGVFRCK